MYYTCLKLLIYNKLEKLSKNENEAMILRFNCNTAQILDSNNNLIKFLMKKITIFF